MQTVASFAVQYHQCLDKDGKIVDALPAFAKDKQTMRTLYRIMKLLRLFDQRVLMLHRTGKMGTFPGTLGQEAIGIGAGSCLQEQDVLVPYYRSQGEMLQRGVKLHEILQYWAGDERSMCYKAASARQDMPIAVCIATQMQHAAGIAAAIKLRQQRGRAVLTGIGDGGTSEGDFYEALNVAGAWRLPLVAYINNNHWAISQTNETQTACQTFAQKAIACGFEGIQVDGNDVIAVKQVIGEALEKARDGGGPTLIECISYRLCAHTTLDDDSKYSTKEQQQAAWQQEPLLRTKQYLLAHSMLTEDEDIELTETLKQEIEQEIEAWQNIPPQPPETIFDYMYAELPQKLREQREYALHIGGQN